MMSMLMMMLMIMIRTMSCRWQWRWWIAGVTNVALPFHSNFNFASYINNFEFQRYTRASYIHSSCLGNRKRERKKSLCLFFVVVMCITFDWTKWWFFSFCSECVKLEEVLSLIGWVCWLFLVHFHMWCSLGLVFDWFWFGFGIWWLPFWYLLLLELPLIGFYMLKLSKALETQSTQSKAIRFIPDWSTCGLVTSSSTKFKMAFY